ncbi:hypothetical protein BrE312_0848 [Brenneria sp. EniD312]|nr:hypothetical protein BrE312_0848 [Brenneria sp. EniD312]
MIHRIKYQWQLYPSYFKLQMRWLRSVTRITYLSKLIGIPSLAAFLQLELFRVYTRHTSSCRCVGCNSNYLGYIFNNGGYAGFVKFY